MLWALALVFSALLKEYGDFHTLRVPVLGIHLICIKVRYSGACNWDPRALESTGMEKWPNSDVFPGKP